MEIPLTTAKKVFRHLVTQTELGKMTWSIYDNPSRLDALLNEGWEVLIGIHDQNRGYYPLAIISIFNLHLRKSLSCDIDSKYLPDFFRQIKSFYYTIKNGGYNNIEAAILLQTALPGFDH